MKKVLSLVVALIMLVSVFGVVAFAAGSKTDAVEITSAKDADGKDVALDVTDTSIPWLTEEEAAKIIGGGVKASDLKIVWQKDVKAPKDAKFPLSITFHADGTAGLKAWIFHHGGAWEIISTGTGTDVAASCKSLSPIAFVVQKEAASETDTGDDKTSPKTGVSISLAVAGLSLVVASAAAVISKKSKKA